MSSGFGLDNQGIVYLGIWTNWSKGRVLGVTLTTDQLNGTLLIAATALFISTISVHAWKISCYVIHHLRSTKGPLSKDALHHQILVTLRNSDSASTALCKYLSMYWSWRKAAVSHRLRRIWPMACYALIIVFLTTIAGIFSSRIASLTGNEVLLSGANCSIMSPSIPNNDTDAILNFTNPALNTQIINLANYVQNCYTVESSAQNCSVFVKGQLHDAKIDRNSSCPFPGNQAICKNEYGNILIDSGLLDSNDDLGLNMPPSLRIKIRLVNKCAPLLVDGYKTAFNSSQNGVTVPYARYLYGSRTDQNYTYQSPITPYEEIHFFNGTFSSIQEYTIRLKGWHQKRILLTFDRPAIYDSGGNDVWRPIPNLLLRNSTIEIYFLSSYNILYPEPIEGDIYAAHQGVTERIYYSANQYSEVTLYTADEPVTVLACTNQAQFCSPNLPASQPCSPMVSYMELSNLLYTTSQGLYPNQSMDFLQSALAFVPFYSTVEQLGAFALESRSHLYNGLSTQLPKNQWQKDVEYWHYFTLASLQRSPSGTALFSSSSSSKLWTTGPTDSTSKYICSNVVSVILCFESQASNI
jgi:hypothetical protein